MKNITAEQLKQALAEGKEKILIVDVREMDEVAEMPLLSGVAYYVNLPMSVIQMLPKEEVKERFEKLSAGAGVKLDEMRVILSCRSGARSGAVQAELARDGIETENLEGGYLGWL
jgi:rhodanese-related sulfurtransferase